MKVPWNVAIDKNDQKLGPVAISGPNDHSGPNIAFLKFSWIYPQIIFGHLIIDLF